MSKPPLTMEMLSGRIPADLYAWFATLQIEGAVTSSDKLRILLAQLKRQHDGTMDYAHALGWIRDLGARLRQDVAVIEHDTGSHSELLNTLLEHLVVMFATVVSAHPQDKTEVQVLEEQLVKRTAAMAEGLLRQALTPLAATYDPEVVRRHSGNLVELARLIPSPKQGAENG